MIPVAPPVKQIWPLFNSDVKNGPWPGMAGSGGIPSGTSLMTLPLLVLNS